MLILARLLHLDIRVKETAKLYEVKRGKELRDICADRELDRPVDFCELPHPTRTPEFGFENVEDLRPSTTDRLAIVEPHIYTGGSRSKANSVRSSQSGGTERNPGTPHISSNPSARYSRQRCSRRIGQ
ncbi:hypothetical protein EVAR_29241_1 [Eumeta japonica]|uniref:Uncharacterized protein n=1 Tax=Eumeta variegata TaxID=151549 RepID=A0A4C1VJ23_EUMVA|nr:hypothetical protein EVAR_29241_1 [Eumeta japonica]